MKKIICLLTVFLLILCGCNLPADGPEETSAPATTTEAVSETEPETQPEPTADSAAPEFEGIVPQVNVPKTKLTANGTGGFSWEAPYAYGARPFDYVIPQLEEIFKAYGMKTSGQYVYYEYAYESHNDKIFHPVRVIDNKYNTGINILFSVSPFDFMHTGHYGPVSCNLQIVSEYFIVGGVEVNFVKLDDGEYDEIMAYCGAPGGDHWDMSVSIYKYDEESYLTPLTRLFELIVPSETRDGWTEHGYDSGFSLKENNGEFSLYNKHSGKTQKLPEVDVLRSYPEYDENSIQDADIHEVKPVDLDGDGTFELLVVQQPWHWYGEVFSLAKYDKEKKDFVVLYGEYVEYDYDDDMKKAYNAFISRAGYDLAKVVWGE